MKLLTTVMKVLAALAAVAGAVYVVATYGDKIVAWAKGLMSKFSCCCDDCCCCDDDCCCDGECDCGEDCCYGEDCCCGEECDCEEAPAEESVQAEEGDFEA